MHTLYISCTALVCKYFAEQQPQQTTTAAAIIVGLIYLFESGNGPVEYTIFFLNETDRKDRTLFPTFSRC